MKRVSHLMSILAASALLAACSSSTDTAGSTSAEPSVSSSSSASSTSSSADAATSATVSTSKASQSSATDAASSSATSVPGTAGATGDVDAQTAAWFDTFCTGVAVLGQLGAGDGPTGPQELGDQLTTIGTTFTDTGAKLAALPPPTFDGGEQLAQQLVTNMSAGGPVFTDYGQRAAQIDPNDEAAGQKFQADFQAAVADLGISNFEPTPEAKAAVKAVPSCAVLGS